MNQLSDLLDSPVEAGQEQEMGSFLEGTVAENANKDHPGMVRVEYTVFSQGKNTSAWLPVLCSYAGAEYGSFLLPEIGDKVLVGFLGPSMEKPFVLGSLYPADARHLSDSFLENNLSRRFRTKGGVCISIQDGENKQTVELTTPKGLQIRLEDEGETLTLSDREGKNMLALDCKSNTLTAQADASLTLKAGKCQLMMDANSGKITLGCAHLELKADQTATLSGGSSLKLEASVLQAEGKQTAALKGSTMTEVSGGILKLN